jgi:hypothetical protein
MCAMKSDIRYRVSGVSKLDMLKLKDKPGVEFAEIPVPPGTYGEPTLFAMTVTITALQILGAYLLKKRTNERTEIEIEEVHADGSTIRKRLAFDKASEESTEAVASIMKQIQGK